MSTGIDIQFVQERYQGLSDDELIILATQNANGLTPEAIDILKVEIQKRGLDGNIKKGIEAQNKEYSYEEIDVFCEIISKLNCPSCHRNTERLNATMIGEVFSFIFFTSYTRKIKIGCPNCLDKANNKALKKSVLLGWWGFPSGLIRTPQAISLNLDSKKTNHLTNHNDYLRSFALNVIGELESYKYNEEMLQQIVTRQIVV